MTVGAIRSPRNTWSRSLARNRTDAMFSWICFASFSASFSFVGVVIRSTWATSTRRLTSSCAVLHASEDFP